MMGARILVAEDNLANLELVRYLLSRAGHEVITTADGLAALEEAQRAVPDLIISDLQMPRMDGYQLLARLRGDPALRAVPVIALTAFSMPGDRVKVMQAGFDSYMSKPLVPETFVAQVEAWLPASRRNGERG